jgi:NADPH:quinone reductase-like Zn-dependent oxidoreductase
VPQGEEQMQAITQQVYGDFDTLEVSDQPIPTPQGDEVLIRVHAASINAADWLLMRGEPYIIRLAFGLRGPRVAIRGRDVAGTVEAVGPSAQTLSVGDEVYGEVSAGSFAQYTVASETVLARKPRTVSFEQAAAVPVAATTALQAIRDAAKVTPGDRVLVNGASGGVGSFAVQLAKAFGGDVTAVCSARNAEQARVLGADKVIDYRTDNFTTAADRYDAIIDLVGNHSLREYRRVLEPKGTLVLASGTGGRVFGPLGRMLAAVIQGAFTRQRFAPLASSPRSADLDVLRELIDAGTLVVSIEKTYPLIETAEALRHFGQQHAQGKIVIAVLQ